MIKDVFPANAKKRTACHSLPSALPYFPAQTPLSESRSTLPCIGTGTAPRPDGPASPRASRDRPKGQPGQPARRTNTAPPQGRLTLPKEIRSNSDRPLGPRFGARSHGSPAGPGRSERKCGEPASRPRCTDRQDAPGRHVTASTAVASHR